MIYQYSSLLRRCGAILYDSLIILALLMLGTWFTLPLTGGEPIPAGNVLYQIYLFAIICGYYLAFWVYSGQTVGMRAWKIRVVTQSGHALSWRIAFVRLIYAVITLLPAGLGLWWGLFNSNRQTLYDHLAKTCVIFQK